MAARQVGPKFGGRKGHFHPRLCSLGCLLSHCLLPLLVLPVSSSVFGSLCLSLPLPPSLPLSVSLFTPHSRVYVVLAVGWTSAGLCWNAPTWAPHENWPSSHCGAMVQGSVWEELGGHCIFLKIWSWKSHSIASADLHLRPTLSQGDRGPPPSGGCRL